MCYFYLVLILCQLVLADGLAMIDIRSKPWPVLYANDTFAEAAGRQVEDCTQQGFWDQFEPAGLGEKVGPGVLLKQSFM